MKKDSNILTQGSDLLIGDSVKIKRRNSNIFEKGCAIRNWSCDFEAVPFCRRVKVLLTEQTFDYFKKNHI